MTTTLALEGTTQPLKGIRRTTSRRMVTAWQAPVFHLTVAVDMTDALAVKERAPGATVTDALLAACGAALQQTPAVNAHYGDEAVTLFDQVNIGIAVATDAGLVVPVVHDVPSKDLEELATSRRDVVERARSGSLSMADVVGGTFTVSNLGMLGVDRFDAILNVPQVAILAVGRTEHRQVWNDGAPQWLPLAEMTLTCDHRAVDGATGAQFLTKLKAALESGR
ncbi:pyruvate dehydrogenase E2 component (dihydrolipoamide acetyltransferase) [Georgenia soli]|uniref:Pyruvate dehydrogenase E2 component (Dihydrolipoamide acetyltransferase) n=1 Tax=Georgenia soli TaxID=638953 RepID=A0A2A9F0H8_9MICO|nr:2-oxo acid dehydrogenase subunit E2 [Georgenia soli]PFG44897.1 pyruvate dehydrogenase E2 component (dihydrolipoamide acetyltransferase) [Georgenia soli]